MLTWRCGPLGWGAVWVTADSSWRRSSRRLALDRTLSNVQKVAGAVFTSRPIARPNSNFPMSSSGIPYLQLESYRTWISAEPCS